RRSKDVEPRVPGYRRRVTEVVPCVAVQNTCYRRRCSATLISSELASILSTILPTWEVTVLDPDTKSLTKVDVLQHMGAEISFVNSAFAEKLNLPLLEEKHIRLPNEKKCKLANIDVWDKDGTLHSQELLTNEVLTTAFTSPKISNEDLSYVRSLDLSVSLAKSSVIKPKILLGCDQLWSFFRSDVASIALPFGLHLLPTKLGHLVSGKAKNTEVQAQQVSQCKQEEWLRWEKCWSMNIIQVSTASATDSEVTADEQEQRENFWTLDAAETDEFAGTEKEAKESMDREVWLKFKESIQKREDRYYVLSWKHQHPTLPYNRAIVYRRLVNVWNTVSKNRELLEQYNNTFKDQLRQGVIKNVKGKREYSTPVVTHSIRCQEEDRDATRCLWLKDHKLPPTPSNIQVFRVTRVTFDLKSSPFLLAAATQYHLDNYEGEASLVQGISRNLYVDNLVLTTNTLEEAQREYANVPRPKNEPK
uniref:DUF1758 domain-containing protein n=1 Tax=Heligmosomoides polygyrus TaxID=6339 RepID=A0A183GNK0_HELPZ